LQVDDPVLPRSLSHPKDVPSGAMVSGCAFSRKNLHFQRGPATGNRQTDQCQWTVASPTVACRETLRTEADSQELEI